MWGLPPDAEVDGAVFEAGIHPDDLPRVRGAIARCVDPAGDGRYTVEYRVIGRDDAVTRHIATSGRTTFVDGRAVGFIGAAIDVTESRRNEAAVRSNEALFRGFAENSSNLIWIGDPVEKRILYRSPAYEKIFGVACSEAPADFAEWMNDVHPEDRQQVEHALRNLEAGDVVKFEYRFVRRDGAVRLLRETGFPILDEQGVATRIGGITEDLTRDDARQVYIVCGRAAEARRLAGLVRAGGYRARTFASGSAFLDVAPVLSPGCVLVDLRKGRDEGLSVPRELKARSIPLAAIVLDSPGAEVGAAVAAMKAGAADYLVLADDPSFHSALARALAESVAAAPAGGRDETAGARIAGLTPREREVLAGLVDGGTNKSIRRRARHQSADGRAPPRPGDEPARRDEPHGNAPDRPVRRPRALARPTPGAAPRPGRLSAWRLTPPSGPSSAGPPPRRPERPGRTDSPGPASSPVRRARRAARPSRPLPPPPSSTGFGRDRSPPTRSPRSRARPPSAG